MLLHARARHVLRLFAMCGVMVSVFSYAESASGGVLDDLSNSIISTTAGWMDSALGYADSLFIVVASTFFVVTLVRYYSRNNTWDGVWQPLVDGFLYVLLPWILLKLARTILPHIFSYASTLSTGITGVVLTGPGDIFNLGVSKASDLFVASCYPLMQYSAGNAIGFSNGTSVLGMMLPGGQQFEMYMGIAIIGAIAALILVLCFGFIAAELLISFADIYMVLSIGAVQLGWAAAPGTKVFAEQYWSSVMGSVFRLVVIYAFATFIASFIQKITISMMSTDFMTDLKADIGLLVIGPVAWYMAMRLAARAEHALSGKPSMSMTPVAQAGVTMATRKIT